MVEIQPVEGRELIGGHLRLGHERPGLQDDDRATGPGEVGGDHAARGPRPDDHHVGLELDDTAAGIGRAARGHDRRGLGGDRLRCPREPELQQERIASILAGVRVREEREQALERLVGSPLAAEARARPAVQVPLPGRRRQVAEADGATREGEVEERLLERPQDEPELPHDGGVHSGLVALDGEPGAASGAAAHERLRHGREGLELGGGPAPGQGGVGVRHGRGRRSRRRE